MRRYIIDGNNVIGKISLLKRFQKKDKQASREKLLLMIERYFNKRNAKVSLHFDGHPKEQIGTIMGKITYSNKLTADEMIKKEIEKSNNPKNIIVITSDFNLKEFAQKCSCNTISSEEFGKQISTSSSIEEESRRIQELDDTDEFKKLFGVK
jgi:predicted RNA-binding protein with PIN domain